jgi:hypothetical protein
MPFKKLGPLPMRSSPPSPELRFSCDATAHKSPASPLYSESAEMKSLRERLYARPDFSDIPADSLERLFCSLRGYLHQQAAVPDYDEASRAAELGEAVLHELERRGAQRRTATDLTFSSPYGYFEEDWEARFRKHDSLREAKMAALLDRQRADRAHFEKVWTFEMPRRYRKPSSQLLQLRKQEKALALCGDFDGAKAVHEQVLDLQQREWQGHQSLLVADYGKALAQLEAKQQAQIELLEDTRAHERDILGDQYEKAKCAVINRQIVVATKIMEAEKGYRMTNREKPPIGRESRFALSADRSGVEDVLLEPLTAPNEPTFREAYQKRKREIEQRKREFHQKNATATLAKYTLTFAESDGEWDEEEAVKALGEVGDGLE